MVTAVVGGGPAGLAAAYRLSEDPYRHVLLIERAPTLGGLAAGMTRGDVRVDFGPHRLHAGMAPHVLADLRHLLGPDLLVRPRRGLIYVGGRYLPFPPRAATLWGLGGKRLLTGGLGLLAARLHQQQRPPESFEDAVVAQVGRPLYRLFYGPFAKKAWGFDGIHISAQQAARRVNQRGLRDILAQLRPSRQHAAYFYPRFGFGQIPAAYEAELRRRPNVRISTTATITNVLCVAGAVSQLDFTESGAARTVTVDHVVWSAPLTILPEIVDPSAPAAIRAAVARLQHRAVVIAFLQVDASQVLPQADTCYFPCPEVPFNRVANQRQFSPDTVPPGQTVLTMDIGCQAGDAWFTMPDAELQRHLLGTLEAVGVLRGTSACDFWTARLSAAYPIYHVDYERPLGDVMGWADEITNLWLTGRQGLFLHNNTHHSLQMGYEAADAIRRNASRHDWASRIAEFATWSVAD